MTTTLAATRTVAEGAAGAYAGLALATVVLRVRNRVYRRLAEIETRDDDADGIPDVYQREERGS